MKQNSFIYFLAAAVIISFSYFAYFSRSSYLHTSKLELKIAELQMETKRLEKINRDLDARLSDAAASKHSENELTRRLYSRPGDTVVELILPELSKPEIKDETSKQLWIFLFILLIVSFSAGIYFYISKLKSLRHTSTEKISETQGPFGTGPV